MVLSSMQLQKVSVTLWFRRLQCLVLRSVLSVFINLRSAECVCSYYGLRVCSQTNKLNWKCLTPRYSENWQQNQIESTLLKEKLKQSNVGLSFTSRQQANKGICDETVAITKRIMMRRLKRGSSLWFPFATGPTFTNYCGTRTSTLHTQLLKRKFA